MKRGATESKLGSFQSITALRTKKAATEWTVGKLLTIILLVVVLVLVIYGFSTGAMKPLVEKVTGLFDGVLILFHLKEDTSSTSSDCLAPVRYENIGEMGYIGDLTRCKTYCKVDLSSIGQSYSLNYKTNGMESYRKVYTKEGFFGGTISYSAVLDRWMGVKDSKMTEPVSKTSEPYSLNFAKGYSWLVDNEYEESQQFIDVEVEKVANVPSSDWWAWKDFFKTIRDDFSKNGLDYLFVTLSIEEKKLIEEGDCKYLNLQSVSDPSNPEREGLAIDCGKARYLVRQEGKEGDNVVIKKSWEGGQYNWLASDDTLGWLLERLIKQRISEKKVQLVRSSGWGVDDHQMIGVWKENQWIAMDFKDNLYFTYSDTGKWNLVTEKEMGTRISEEVIERAKKLDEIKIFLEKEC